MRVIVKSIWALCLPLSSCLIAQAAEPFPCRFDSYFAGELESAEKRPEGYHIELLAGGDSMEYLVPQSAPEYYDAAQFVQKTQQASMPPEGAFLLNNNTICGFTPLFRDEIVVKSHRRDGDRYILSVCTDETSNCYTLRISAGSPLFSDAENIISIMTSAPTGVEVNDKYEMIGTYKLDDSMQSYQKAPPNNLGERFGDRVRTDNEEWRNPRYGLSFKAHQPQPQSSNPPTAAAPTANVAPILLWHSNTGWVQGMCSYQLTFDGQGVFFESATGIEKFSLSVDVFDGQGNRIASDTLHTEPFADSDATRTTVSYWEGDCEAKRIVIWKAEAVIDGEVVDLLKTNRLRIQESPLKEAIEFNIKK